MALPESFHELAGQVRNWGRWGDDDERGTLNLIDEAAVRRGAAAVRRGRSFSLAIPLSQDGPQVGAIPGRVNPLRSMTMLDTALSGDEAGVRCNDDVVVMGLQSATHWDSLAHVSYGGVIWNGFPAWSVNAQAGATRCGIDKVGAVVSRGVLLDVARTKGIDRLAGATPITADDLDAAAAAAAVEVVPGDIVLVRTGQMQLLRQPSPDRVGYLFPAPGLSTSSVPWFRHHDVAAVAIDTMTFEVYPWEDDKVAMPVHLLHLVDMGMIQGQNWNLEELAADCAEDGVYEFLLEASPEPFVGGLGGPVHPVAVK